MSGGAVVGDAFCRFAWNEKATTFKDVEELVKAIGKSFVYLPVCFFPFLFCIWDKTESQLAQISLMIP